MIKHKYINVICTIIILFAALITVIFINGTKFGIQVNDNTLYQSKLFDTSYVHTIDIIVEDSEWDKFSENALDKEYIKCNLIIDDEAYNNVAIRTKGNSSLRFVQSSNSYRFSFKIEFDHFDESLKYYGLDKMTLNNIYQDKTYMKDYLSYQMLNFMDAPSPLASYTYITVNGEDFGLYLAVEAVEDSFIDRVYGSASDGELYKPESVSSEEENQQGNLFSSGGAISGDNLELLGNVPRFLGQSYIGLNLGYTDDDYSSYSYIFDTAKTEITDKDKDEIIAALKKISAKENLNEALDIEAVINYFVVHNFVLNFDSYTGIMIHNYYIYEEEGLLSIIGWDYNLSYGAFGYDGNISPNSYVNFPIDSPVVGDSLENRPLLASLIENEEYIEIYHNRYKDFISSYFDSGYFDSEVDRVVEMISPYVEKDPTSFTTYERFLDSTKTLKEFCLLRCESIEAQITNSSNNVDASFIDMRDLGGY